MGAPVGNQNARKDGGGTTASVKLASGKGHVAKASSSQQAQKAPASRSATTQAYIDKRNMIKVGRGQSLSSPTTASQQVAHNKATGKMNKAPIRD